MSKPITIKHSSTDTFRDICFSENLTQNEFFEKLLEVYKQYPAILSDNKGLNSKIADLQAQLDSKQQGLQDMADILSECRMTLGLSVGDSIIEAIKQALDAGKSKPANSNILQDISEYKGLQKPDFLLDLTKSDLLASPERSSLFDKWLELGKKYKLVKDYMLAINPAITDEQIAVALIEEMHDEILETKKIQ